jgi:hypothetical protein
MINNLFLFLFYKDIYIYWKGPSAIVMKETIYFLGSLNQQLSILESLFSILENQV